MALTSDHRLRVEDFDDDPHARRYRQALDAHPDATRRLLELLNAATNEQRLVDAEQQGMPALAGVVRFVEGDHAIEVVLQEGPDSYRFRQAVGVAVKLKMARLGWHTTGRKGAVKNARFFTKAERYEADPPDGGPARALDALARVASIGSEAERLATGDELQVALAATRSADGRAF